MNSTKLMERNGKENFMVTSCGWDKLNNHCSHPLGKPWKLSLQECVVHTTALESPGDLLRYCLERGRKPGFLSPKRNL